MSKTEADPDKNTLHSTGQVGKTDDHWRKRLSPLQYKVLRQKGTEAPFSGELLYLKDKGKYVCAACGQALFSSEKKFESATPGLTGWPTFSDVVEGGAVELKDDRSAGMQRIEVVCKNCGGHLGHLFEAGDSETGKHYCINSAALNFKPEKK